jgi:AraC-like DNA-binding protein
VENPNMAYPIYQLKGHVKMLDMGFVHGERVHPDRVLDFWVLGIVTKGNMQIHIEHENISLTSNTYYVLPPFVHHWGSTRREVCDIIFFHWELNKDEQACEPTISLPLVGKLPAEINYLSLYQFLKKAVDFALLPLEQVSAQIDAILAQLSIMQHYEQSTSDPMTRLAYHIMEYLRTNITQEVKREQVAADLGYSYGHLDRVFRQQFGMSIFHKRQQLCIEMATELLLMGKPIKEVALLIGFHDYHYFLKVFKRVHGVSPGTLQKRANMPG